MYSNNTERWQLAAVDSTERTAVEPVKRKPTTNLHTNLPAV